MSDKKKAEELLRQVETAFRETTEAMIQMALTHQAKAMYRAFWEAMGDPRALPFEETAEEIQQAWRSCAVLVMNQIGETRRATLEHRQPRDVTHHKRVVVGPFDLTDVPESEEN